MTVGPGTILAGKYRLDSLIGRGGMGTVWRAQHLGLHAPVAVKLLDVIDIGRDASARFHREAHAAASIRSPHIVQILDHGTDPELNLPFIVMELLEGESLAERLQRLGRLSPAEVARLFTQLGRALGRAHESGIVHRDLKPDNVFVVRNDDDEVVKVLDFGIAKADSRLIGDSATRTGAVMGTAYYMSPEQISGAKSLDFRSDLWALGVMACECLTGVRPFDADTIGGLTLKICVEAVPRASSLGPVPNEFDGWFERAIARDPRLRFGSAREATESLRRVCLAEAGGSGTAEIPAPNASGVPAASLGTGAPLSRSSRDEVSGLPKPIRIAPVAAALAAMFALAMGAWSLRSGAPHAAREGSSRGPSSAIANTAAPLQPDPRTAASLGASAAAPATSPTPQVEITPAVAPSPISKPVTSASAAGGPARSPPFSTKPVMTIKPAAPRKATPSSASSRPARDVLDVRN
jgi:serine/threonine protein kinase